jgi:ABC-type methionine transport system ATPase subunit
MRSNRNPSSTKIRLQLSIPSCYSKTPVLSRLISKYKLVVNILIAKLEINQNNPGLFEIELQGTPQQISEGLGYLETLKLRISSKPNPDGDSWYY